MRFFQKIPLIFVSVLLNVSFSVAIYAGEAKTTTNLDNSLEGLQLGATIDAFVRDPEWKEVFGLEKKIFDPGLSLAKHERLYKKISGEKIFYCGFVFGKLYKISLSTTTADADLYWRKFSDSYGKAKQINTNWCVWENDKVSLELMKSPQGNISHIFLATPTFLSIDLFSGSSNIFLTDKKLLRSAPQ